MPQVWQFQDDDGGWGDFQDQQQEILRGQFRGGGRGQAQFQMTIGDNWRGEPNIYTIDLVALTQTNEGTGKVRAIRRREADRWTCLCAMNHQMGCRVCTACGRSRAGHLENLPESAPAPSAPVPSAPPAYHDPAPSVPSAPPAYAPPGYHEVVGQAAAELVKQAGAAQAEAEVQARAPSRSG